MDEQAFPTSLPDFQKLFPNEDACRAYLEAVRWPDGFSCPKCGHVAEPYRFANRSSAVLRCVQCKANASLTAGTVMHASHTPLTTWFWAAYLMTTQTPGQSALQFQRQLGLTRYETAFGILHKLRAGMVRLERDQIGEKWPVEIDETFVGGKTRGRGSGNHSKVAVVGAVEVRERQDGEALAAKGPDAHKFGIPTKRKFYAGRLRLQVVPDRYAATLESFVYGNVAPHATIKTDGWRGYSDLAAYGYGHESMVLDGDPAKADAHLPMIHIVFANLKSWILGTHHGRIEPRHLQAYLNEFVFRFNRRFYPMTAFNSVLGLATQTLGPTYSELYSGRWQHPASNVFATAAIK